MIAANSKDADKISQLRDTFKVLVQLRQKAITVSFEDDDSRQRRELELLQTLFNQAKKIEKGPALLEYIKQSETLLTEETRESIHFKMTQDRLAQSEPLMDNSELSSLEKASNELCVRELKEILAKTLGFEETSLVCFSEKVYIRAKVLILGQMLKGGKKEIALKYLKKIVFSHNRNYRVQTQLIERAAKLMI